MYKYTSELRADELGIGRNQIYLKLKLAALQFMPGIKNFNLNFF
jgi:hypothetical protein